MNWLRRLFGQKRAAKRDSSQQLASSVAQAADSVGNATLSMLEKMEEMLQKPLSPQEQKSAEESLVNLESTLGMGLVSHNQADKIKQRIRALRATLAKVSQNTTASNDDGKKQEQVPSSIPGVKYKEREVTDGNTYEVYTAPNRSKALEFLRLTEVREERKYVIVETPEGNFGKDLIMVFDEANSKKIEFGVRHPLPKLTKSRTHCTKCGYPVLPAGAPIPGAKELILLDEMKEKGVGFLCSECGTAWCPFCVSAENPEKCHLCGGSMNIYRD